MERPRRLARLYAPAVYRLAYARTGSRADAEDIMQEVFLRLLRARVQLREQLEEQWEEDGYAQS